MPRAKEWPRTLASARFYALRGAHHIRIARRVLLLPQCKYVVFATMNTHTHLPDSNSVRIFEASNDESNTHASFVFAFTILVSSFLDRAAATFRVFFTTTHTNRSKILFTLWLTIANFAVPLSSSPYSFSYPPTHPPTHLQ
jgi:uncharacterized membrane protein